MTQSMTPQAVGRPIVRVDGHAKVTGKATFSAEWDLPGLLHAVLVTADRGPAKLVALETHQAEHAPGVVAVLTHYNAHTAKVIGIRGKRPGGEANSHSGPPPVPDPSLVLHDDHVRHAGQPIAIVVAESLEQARYGAMLVKARYAPNPPRIDMDNHLRESFPPESIFGEPPDERRGNPQAGWDAGDVRVEAVYHTPAESHNPMEPHATTAVYRGGKLTLYDATQYVYGVKRNMAQICGVPPERVRVVCRYVGGGFGSKGMQWPHVTCAALAAMHVNRPVRLVAERRQMFGFVGFRPRTRQHLRLAAKRDGKLTLVEHHGTNQTSQDGNFVEPVAVATRMLYTTPHLWVSHRLVRLDTQTPTFQRAPGESSGVLALECALDELAYALDMDPVELRLRNYAHRDESRKVPFSSKALDACYHEAAGRFGWSRRTMAPGSMRDGDWLVGWGMATATYPSHRSGASASVQVGSDGRVKVKIATHDLGTGTYTILTQVAADALGIPMERIQTELGDTDYPEAPVSGGSQSAASASNAVHAAAQSLRHELMRRAIEDPASPLHGQTMEAVEVVGGRLILRGQPAQGEEVGAIVRRSGKPHLEAEKTTRPGQELEAYSMHAWGAQFAEVKVDPALGHVRVTRMTGCFAGGRILNPRTARSQMMGGMVMGIGMALLEEVVRDPHQGRVVNGSLEGYLVPVNADVPAMDIHFVPEEDPHVNPLGIKGLGELGIVGAGAAVANAVFHATGKRIRDLPITVEKLL